MLDAVAYIAVSRIRVHDSVEILPCAVSVILKVIVEIFIHDVQRKRC